jgi:hypothetical protein
MCQHIAGLAQKEKVTVIKNGKKLKFMKKKTIYMYAHNGARFDAFLVV